MTAHADHAHDEPLLPVAEALRIIVADAEPLGAEAVDLAMAAGRVLAERIVAADPMPPFDRSMMDGYALRSADLARPPAELRVQGFLPAGQSASGLEVRQGEAIRIMTGAPMPIGADAVQRIERATPSADGTVVRILEGVRAGDNIARRAQDRPAGATLLEPGTWIGAAEIGVLASAGVVRPKVVRRPRAGVLATGDELVAPEATPEAHQIRNSNGPAILEALRRSGAEVRALGAARDDAPDLDVRISEGLEGDLLFVIGGVSVGDKDLVAERLEANGVRTLFHRVAMKPGKPLLFGRRGRCRVFGLPGNPLSALTDLYVFGLPWIQRALGLPAAGLPEVRARLLEPLRQSPGRTWYRLALARLAEGEWVVSPVASSGSGDLASAAAANAFVVMAAETERLDAGAHVITLLWPDFELRAR